MQVSNVNAFESASVPLAGTCTSSEPPATCIPFPNRPVAHVGLFTSTAALPLPDQSTVVVPMPSLNANAALGVPAAAAVRKVQVTSAARVFDMVSVTPLLPPETRAV